MQTTIEVITPEMAQDMLSRNVSNRSYRKKVSQVYAQDMVNGDWELTHQGVAIDANGNLHDGQHRLNAIIIADVPVKMTVTRGCDPESFSMLDIGLKRNVTDTVGVPVKIAGMINKLVSFSTNSTHNNQKIPHSLILKIYNKNIEGFKKFEHFNGTKGITAAVLVGMCMYVYEGGDIDKCSELKNVMSMGKITSTTPPIMVHTGIKLVKNNDKINTTIQSSIIAYKTLIADGSQSVARYDKHTHTRVSAFCDDMIDV